MVFVLRWHLQCRPAHGPATHRPWVRVLIDQPVGVPGAVCRKVTGGEVSLGQNGQGDGSRGNTYLDFNTVVIGPGAMPDVVDLSAVSIGLQTRLGDGLQ